MTASVLFIVFTVLNCDILAQQCESPHKNSFQVSVTSRRNSTGQWLSQLQLEHEDGQTYEEKTAGPWQLDMDHTTLKCEGKETLLITVKAVGPIPVPRSDYELVPEVGYYKLHKNLKTWEEARKVCSQEGTHLAIINSDKEAGALGKILARNPDIVSEFKNEWVFIGFHDLYTEGKFVTIFNQPLSSTGYEKWEPGQPGNNTQENCGLLRINGALGDTLCTRKLAFLCEIEL